MLEALGAGLAGKTRTADALLTQNRLADFLQGQGFAAIITALDAIWGVKPCKKPI